MGTEKRHRACNTRTAHEVRAVSSEKLAKSVGKHSRSAPPATPHDGFPGKWQCGKVAVSELDMLLGKAICIAIYVAANIPIPIALARSGL